ncbi:MAG: DUF445 domain-containing protein, partial [Bacillota bacterium]
MDILSWIAGPVIGAVIGYCTNYIAVKMLFKPHKAVMLGKFRVPFTPGIIPKRKSDMATAVGNAVGNQLLTAEDLQNILLSEEIKVKVIDNIVNALQKTSETQNLKSLCLKFS